MYAFGITLCHVMQFHFAGSKVLRWISIASVLTVIHKG